MNEDRVGALEALLHSPGWTLFTEHLATEWGPSGHTFLAQLDQALSLQNAESAASQARQVRAAQRMVDKFVAWPAEEVARLKRIEEAPEPVLSRGGYHR